MANVEARSAKPCRNGVLLLEAGGGEAAGYARDAGRQDLDGAGLARGDAIAVVVLRAAIPRWSVSGVTSGVHTAAGM